MKQRRSGLTLVEVLVAIFVMGIGLIALLTLFPIGVLRMAQAIRLDKGAQASNNAHHNSMILDLRHDPKVNSETAIPVYQPTNTIPFPPGVRDFFRNPMPGTLSDAPDYGPSYPVFVDPNAYQAASTLISRDWVAGYPGYLCRRTTTAAFAGGSNYVLRWFNSMDDIQFNNAEPGVNAAPPGTPQLFGAGYVRDVRFSWGYLLRRPQTADSGVVDCSIVVFENRPLLALQEVVYPGAATFDLSSNSVTVNFGAIAPNVRAGDWVYDATIIPPDALSTTPDIASGFYRVVSVEQIDAANVKFELERPIRTMTRDPGRTLPGTIIVMDSIVEVFEKGPTRLP